MSELVTIYRGVNAHPDDMDTDYIGIHWTSDKFVARDYALHGGNQRPLNRHGTIIKAVVEKEHIVVPLSDEWKSMGGGPHIFEPEHPEREITIRPGSPVKVERLAHFEERKKVREWAPEDMVFIVQIKNDHSQAFRIFKSEWRWMAKTEPANKVLTLDEVNTLLTQVVGKPVEVIEDYAISKRKIIKEGKKSIKLINPDCMREDYRVGHVLHEAVHLLGIKKHTPEYAAKYLEIVSSVIGSAEAEELTTHYDKYKAKYILE